MGSQAFSDEEIERYSRHNILPAVGGKGQKKIKEIKTFSENVHREVLLQMAPEQRKTMLTNLDILKASMEAVKELMV